MPQFSRKTIIAALDVLDRRSTQAQIGRFILRHGLEEGDVPGGSVAKRVNGIITYLLQNPERQTEDGGNLTDAVVWDIVRHEAKSGFGEEQEPELARGLKRDGFEVVDGELRRTLPEALDLPAADDEVHMLLGAFDFTVALGHLDQAITNHAEGNWAAANAQLRTYFESLLDEIAARLAPSGAALPAPGHGCRTFLANLNPPFFLPTLNEWDGRGRGFIEGFMRRLHPQGSHPGLSGEDDCTFRLHQVLLVSRLLLQRLKTRGKTP